MKITKEHEEKIIKVGTAVALGLCMTLNAVAFDKVSTTRAAYQELDKRYAQVVERLDILTSKPTYNNSEKSLSYNAEDLCVFNPLSLPENLRSVIGIKNNNPCNVKKLHQGQWAGQIGVDKFNHAQFSHPIYGLRAAAMTIINYQKKYNLKTLNEMMSRYAEANSKEYASYLAKRIGVSPDEEINVIRYIPSLIHAMATWECNGNPYPRVWFDALGIQSSILASK